MKNIRKAALTSLVAAFIAVVGQTPAFTTAKAPGLSPAGLPGVPPPKPPTAPPAH